MTVAEAVRQIRREAGRLGSTRKILEQIQREIEAPSPADVEQMAAGERPVSAEAHLIGALQAALVEVENLEVNLRDGVLKESFLGLEEDWKRGKRPSKTELGRIRAGLEALRA